MAEIVDLAKQQISEDGPLAYLQLKPEDIRRIGDNSLAVVARLVVDYLKKTGGKNVVWGGDVNPTGGLNFEIAKPLVMWDADGKHFEDFDLGASSFEVHTPDSTNDRIDRIYAKFEENHDGLTETRHVKVLPSNAGSGEYEINAVVTRRNQLTIIYLEGTAESTPSAPEIPSDGVLLWQIYVPANAVQVSTASFTDERFRFRKLEEIDVLIDYILNILNNLQSIKPPFPARLITIDKSQLADDIDWDDAQEAFNELSHQKGGPGGGGGGTGTTSRVRPEILRTDVLPSAEQSGKLGSTGVLDDGNASAVQIPYISQVDFNGTVRNVVPAGFVDPTLNARLIKLGNAASSKELITPISLVNAVVQSTDGSGIYELQNYTLPVMTNRGDNGNRRIAPRDSRYVDLVGIGDSIGNDSGTWLVFDTLAGTFTNRTADMSGDVPLYGMRFAVTLGNGKVLMAGPGGTAVSMDKGRIKWFLLDTTTGVVTAIANGPGDVDTTQMGEFNIMGDLVTSNKVSLIIWAEGVNTVTNVAQFEYSIDSNSFAQLAVTGTGPSWNRPTPRFRHMDACVFRNGELIVVDGYQGPAHTYIFNHAAKSWRPLNISQPSPNTSPFINGYLFGVSISNVNGRIHLASASSSIWELQSGDTSVWNKITVPALEDLNGNARWGAYMSGMLADGLPMGQGFLLGGAGYQSNLAPGTALNQVWKFSAGGITASNCGGANGITLGGGATSATIAMPDTASGYLSFAVVYYSLTIKGVYSAGQVKARVSFDNHVTDYPVLLGQRLTIAGSPATPIRKIEIVLTGTGSKKPCISEMLETFESAAGDAQTVLVFNPPIGTRFLYIDDTGVITLETTFQKTTSKKCTLLRVIRADNTAPTVLDFVNKTFIHRFYEIPDSPGVIQFDFPVDPTLIRASKYDASGFYKTMTAPTAVPNSTINTSALTSSGETAVIEVEA